MLTHAFHDFPERAEKRLETKAPSELTPPGRLKFAACELWVGQRSCPSWRLPQPALGGLHGEERGPVTGPDTAHGAVRGSLPAPLLGSERPV